MKIMFVLSSDHRTIVTIPAEDSLDRESAQRQLHALTGVYGEVIGFTRSFEAVSKVPMNECRKLLAETFELGMKYQLSEALPALETAGDTIRQIANAVLSLKR